MSAARPIETRLPEVLEALSNPRTPAYYDDILGQVARTRQRPGWTFIERWLPMTALSERVATTPRIPMRLAVAVALLLAALAVSIALIAGSQRSSVPAPFGVAGNGSIVFTDSSGAINVGDLAAGTTKVIVPGADHAKPVYSPDGRWLAYLQGGNITPDIVVSGPSGESPRVLNTTRPDSIGHLTWAPDSRAVIAVVGAEIQAFDLEGGAPRVIFKNPDGSRLNYLDNQNGNLADIFRPPAGDEILFIGTAGGQIGLFRQALAGVNPIPVVTDKMVPSVWFENSSGAQWSPDGRRIVLTIHPPETPAFGRAYLVNADGSGLERVSKLDLPGIVIDEEHTAWSPDGTRIAFGRWNNDADGKVDPRPVVIVDLATGEEREASNREVNGYSGWSWSPDGSSILQVPGDGSEDAGTVIVVDAATGQSHKVGWTSGSAPTWQRTLPGT